MRPQRTAENPSPAWQPRAAISSAQTEYPILERLEAARQAAEKEGKVLCPWCLAETGEFRPMIFRDMPNGRHYYCTKCGKGIEAD